jgi:putative ABC transport system permease protein
VYILSSFALIALLLASIGVFGTMHYAVVRRTREVGVRIALGARKSDVIRMVFAQGMTLAAVGIVLGLAGSFLLMRTVESLLFGVTPTDPATFLMSALLLAVSALLACYLPARRAAQIEPAVALRSE